ncbi:MAG: phosphoribosylglycinamide formyltransferase [Flavobacteriales bacterium]|nr:phosphoribosylglycinamide formyltransferase [Flavobacteriales bacterium]
MRRIAILASGTGSNAECIMRHVQGVDGVEVCLVLSNRSQAPVLEKAQSLGIRAESFTKEQWASGHVLQLLCVAEVDVVVLAGFLLLVPPALIEAFPDRIINIHPALLPKHGGKGMYGMNVHRAVKEAGDTETGITVHLVNAEYDKGRVLFRASCPVLPTDTPDDIAHRVQQLEHRHFAEVVCGFALGL